MSRLNAFLQAMRSHESLPCLIDEHGTWTYGQLLDEIDRWSRRFDSMSVGLGTAVGLRADYSPAAVAAILALFARGCCVALIPRGTDYFGFLKDACCSRLLRIDTRGEFKWDVVAEPPSHPLLQSLKAGGGGGVVIFTSGSTGQPKAALQSVERFLHKFTRPGRQLRTLAFLLFDHIAGLDTLFYTLASGGSLVLTRRRDPDSIMALIRQHEVQVLPASPSFLRLMCMTCDDAHAVRVPSLQVITYGAEPMDASTLATLNERFPQVQITQKYGTTETGSPRTISRGNDSLWVKFRQEGVETKVVDDVLWIRSEGTILGYLNAPPAVDAEGWYCTGDLVEVDDGWIRFLGRQSDAINVGGEKVSPAEVEQTLLEVDFVRGALVAGEPHVMMGHIVTAKIWTDDGIDEESAARKLRAHCRSRLAPHKIPVKMEFVSGSLTTERQKLQRNRALRDLL